MKKINCNIANDLIPLYIDEVLSEDSREMLEEHLAKCDKCKDTMSKMKQDIPIIEDRDINPFKKVRKKFMKGIVLVALVFTGLYAAFVICDLTIIPFYYSEEYLKENLKIVETEEGLFLRYDDFASRADVYFVDGEDGEVKLYLGENVFGRFRIGWNEHLTYVRIAEPEPKYSKKPITKVSYCDADGNILFVIWEKDAETE